MTDAYDLIIIGAGAGGLTAAGFAARLGAKVALVEKDRVGGDCTWTGCVPSKALLKAAKVAHKVRTAAQYGILTEPPKTDMTKVRAYVQRAVAEVYQHETPEQLERDGVEVVFGAARFLDTYTIQVGERDLSARHFLITTGAGPFIPPISGLQDVPYVTYEQIFENDHLPKRLLVIGAGPVGIELAQAYQRLGSQVTLIDTGLLPGEEPEAARVLGQVFAGEGIQFIKGLVSGARMDKQEIVLHIEGTGQEARGDVLLVAAGRAPYVKGLGLDQIGVAYSFKGIEVDSNLRTNVKHIYAAGDCVMGNYQFTHFAGWQAFQAARNALLPGSSDGFSPAVPRVIFTDPEVAHVGLTEAEAREKLGQAIRVTYWPMNRTDRAVSENDQVGFIKVIHKKDGALLGVAIVAGRAGEVITEFVLALQRGLKLGDLAHVIHPYPTYSTAVMQLAADVAVENVLSGLSGKVIRRLSKISKPKGESGSAPDTIRTIHQVSERFAQTAERD